jgi:hypothetical protein
LNLHGLLHYHLKVARLPIPPYAQHKINCRNALTAWQPAHCQRFWWQVKRFLNSEKEIWQTTPGGTNWHHIPTIVRAGENDGEPNPALAAAAAAAGGIDVKNATGEIALDFSTLLGRAKAHVTKTPSRAKPEELVRLSHRISARVYFRGLDATRQLKILKLPELLLAEQTSRI